MGRPMTRSVYALVVLVLGSAALIASVAPTGRAMAVNPASVLQVE